MFLVLHLGSFSFRLTSVFNSEGEVKTLMIQLLRGVRHLHDNWILHRDLKTSNLLLSHKGILKVSQPRTLVLSVFLHTKSYEAEKI